MSLRGRSIWPWLAAMLAMLALAAPLVANSRPLLQWSEGRGWSAPAFTGERALRPGEEAPETVARRSFVLRAPIPYSPGDRVLRERLQPPGREHWLGTDHLGRDVASRLVHGARISLGVGALAMLIALTLGLSIGGAAGYLGGWVDLGLSRVIEIFTSFPALVLVLTFAAYFPPGFLSLAVIIGVVGWTGMARLARGEALRIRGEGFVDAARASGASRVRILARHVLPQALYMVIVPAAFLLARAVLVESALSLIGVGVPEPTASWGNVLALSRTYLRQGWWLAFFPGVCIFLTLTTCNRLGEQLARRDASRSVRDAA